MMYTTSSKLVCGYKAVHVRVIVSPSPFAVTSLLLTSCRWSPTRTLPLPFTLYPVRCLHQ